LAKFVNHQRGRWRENKLSEDHVAKLSDLPSWSFDAKEAQWDEVYHLVRQWLEQGRGGNDPKGRPKYPSRMSNCKEERKLGNWVHNQRQPERKKSDRRDRLLEALPNWSWGLPTATPEQVRRRAERLEQKAGSSGSTDNKPPAA